MTGRGFGRALFSSPGGRSPPPLSPKDTPVAPFPGQTVPPGPRVPPSSGSAGSAPCPEEVFSFLVFLYRLRRQRTPLLAPRPAGRSVPLFSASSGRRPRRSRLSSPAAWASPRLSLPERFLPRQRSRRPQGRPSRKRPFPSSAVPAPRSGSDAVRKAPPRSPKTPTPRAATSVLRRSFRSSSSSIGSAGSAPRSSPRRAFRFPPLFPRLRPLIPATRRRP